MATKDKPMMTAHGTGGKYTAAKLSLWEFTLWLRDTLIGLVRTRPASRWQKRGLTCKGTTLSWMSKAGMNKAVASGLEATWN